MEQFKILNLKAENIKRLQAVDITPDPDFQVITGRNAQGKSSVLDSILYALLGEKYIDAKPIRTGAEKGSIELDVGDYKITRTFTEKGSYLSVTNQDGFKTTSPQKMLDGLLGSITFDPLEFTRLDAKKQYDTLRGLVKIDADLDKLEVERQQAFDDRTQVKRDAKALEAQIEAIKFQEDTPDEPVDITELAKKVQQAMTLSGDINALTSQIMGAEDEIKRMEAMIAQHRGNIGVWTEQKANSQAALKVLGDVEAAQEKINNAQTINQNVTLKKSWQQKMDELTARRTEEARLDAIIDSRVKAKQDALAEAEFPVPGLSFAEGIVLYNDTPFSQASSAEQIRVSTAIAMAMNPRLRVIRIKDGSLLDDDSMDALRNMAKEHAFQIWIERVNDNDPVAIVIEDGLVAGAELQQAAE